MALCDYQNYARNNYVEVIIFPDRHSSSTKMNKTILHEYVHSGTLKSLIENISYFVFVAMYVNQQDGERRVIIIFLNFPKARKGDSKFLKLMCMVQKHLCREADN